MTCSKRKSIFFVLLGICHVSAAKETEFTRPDFKIFNDIASNTGFMDHVLSTRAEVITKSRRLSLLTSPIGQESEQAITLCSQLSASLRSNSSASNLTSVLTLANQSYDCFNDDLDFVAPNTLLRGPSGGESAPFLISRNSTARIPAGTAVTLDGVDLLGGWT
eukprot:CAMPEP_0172168004 /NCGR_PEP_ID=MMETSP1050-20130122/9889_1 /TAXON_ID=233186 /ORGANISM="Cryptomonas curvata, Strain CCAP979/52" /LENGTH=162 /DNA_ID=CAMNT_0012838863 /DNA_START=101 /DNA_END=585 /DNA_ORIENTATION=-